jgi:putative endonuclease
MKYFVYILKSKVDGSFYIGYTSNLEKRILQHNNGESIYTSRKTPWELHYCESVSDKSEAIKREKFLKKQKNSDFFERLKIK